jgi:GTP:adenosylcobinamide-phosphate guanylyltransferase
MDKKLWTKRNVEIIETPLEEYIADFEHHLNHT